MEVDATGYAGKRIRFTVPIRSEGVALGAAVWLRLDDRVGTYTLCNLTASHHDLRLKGTHDYTPLSCTLDVPASTKRLLFGINLAGPGRTWVKQGTLEEVGADVAVNLRVPSPRVSESPVYALTGLCLNGHIQSAMLEAMPIAQELNEKEQSNERHRRK